MYPMISNIILLEFAHIFHTYIVSKHSDDALRSDISLRCALRIALLNILGRSLCQKNLKFDISKVQKTIPLPRRPWKNPCSGRG